MRILPVAVLAAACVAGSLGCGRKSGSPEAPPAAAPPFVERPLQFVTDQQTSESTADKAGGDVKSTLMKGVREGKWDLAASGLAGDFRARFPALTDGDAVPAGFLRPREYRGTGWKETDGPGFLAVIRDHTKGWQAIERTTWRTFEFLLAPDGKSAFAQIHFQLAGVTPAGTRGDLQASLRCTLVLGPEKWRLRRLEVYEGARLDSTLLPFADISDPTGFHWNESPENRANLDELINARGPNTIGGLSVVDWNRDGFADLLATMASRDAALFLNDGHGGFNRQALPFRQTEECGYVCLFVDLDNDGHEELVTGQILAYEGRRARIGIYTRRNGKWELLANALDFEPAPRGALDLLPQTVVPCDVNRDGLLDLYVGIYSHAGSRKERFNTIAAYDGGDDLLFINHGGLRFTEESDSRGLRSTQFTLAVTAFDLDGDGDEDLIQGNDYGPNIFWENDGKGRFREVKDHALAQGSSYTMGLAVADYDNTGRWAVHVSNMYSHAGNRILSLKGLKTAEMTSTVRMLAAGNWQFEQDEKGAWKEVSVERGVNYAEWAWSCNFFDIENDGDRDLFVTNGYTSHKDAKAPDF